MIGASLALMLRSSPVIAGERMSARGDGRGAAMSNSTGAETDFLKRFLPL